MTIKEMRQEMMLTQRELAKKMHISSITIMNWEKGYFEPKPVYLKYLTDLYNSSKTMKLTGEQIKAIRKSKGLTQEEFAKALNLGKCTVRDWESGRHEIRAVHRRKIYDFCANTK